MNQLTVIAAMLGLVGQSAAAEAPAAADASDHEAAFAKSFPGAGGEHQIVDWALYAALVGGDLVGYAAAIDPAVGRRLKETKGKAYQTQEVEDLVKGDKRLRASFEEQRRRIRSMVLYVEGEAREGCRRALVYVGREFRLLLGDYGEGQDPLSTATVAPSCPQRLNPGFQITAGRSPRFKCWPGRDATTCGYRLPDMPVELKRVIENEYPRTIRLRWQWRGVAGPTRIGYVDDNGNRVARRNGIAVTVPVDLGLEFVDAGGRILWTAPPGGWSALAAARPGP